MKHLEDHLNYITGLAVRKQVSGLLDEIKNWKPGNVSIDAISYGISIKINGRVFVHLYPRRWHYIIGTYDASDEWKEYAVKSEDELAAVKPTAKSAMDRRVK